MCGSAYKQAHWPYATAADRDGLVIDGRDSLTDEATYRDRVQLPPGAHTFEFLDSDQDGLIRHWWLRDSSAVFLSTRSDDRMSETAFGRRW